MATQGLVFVQDHGRRRGTSSPPKLACEGCRRLKMRCVMDGTPPCQRCRRTGRQCVPSKSQRRPAKGDASQEQPSRQRPLHHTGNLSVTPGSHLELDSQPAPVGVASGSKLVQDPPSVGHTILSSPDSNQSLGRENTSQLPSIYSAAPIDTVSARDHPVACNDTVTPSASGISASGATPKVWSWPVNAKQSSQSGSGVIDPNGESAHSPPISDRDLARFMHYFSQKMVLFVPAIRPIILDEMADDISRDRTAPTLIAYAAASFVPGAESSGDRLYHEVVRLLNTAVVGSWSSNLRTLYGLMVLYNYTDIPSSASRSSQIKPQRNISFWVLKSLTESTAQALQCHRAFATVHAASKNDTPGIIDSLPYQLYLCWLWLFVMSHYVSLATATPPSIHTDIAIKSGPTLLRLLEPSSAATLSLANQVEICLIWDNMRQSKTSVGEWWCAPLEPNGDQNHHEATDQALAELQDIEKRLSSQMTVGETHEPVRPCHCRPEHALNGRDMFHVRFARFCIYSYALRDYSSTACTAVDNRTTHPLIACFDAALDMVQWNLDLCFTERIAVVHASDSSSIMLALCCLFVLQCAETAVKMRQSLQHLGDILWKVHQVGQIMSDLSVHYRRHGPDYGQHIQASALQMAAKLEEQADSEPLPAPEMPSDRLFDASVCDFDEVGLYDLFDSHDLDTIYPLDKLWTFGKEP